MYIFRYRLIDFSQCLKLKAAFRHLRTFGELLILLNSSTQIQLYHGVRQRPTLTSHLRTSFYMAICQCCPTQQTHGLLLGRTCLPTQESIVIFFFLHPSSHDYPINNDHDIIIDTQLDSSVSHTRTCTHIPISLQSHNPHAVDTITNPTSIFEEIDIQESTTWPSSHGSQVELEMNPCLHGSKLASQRLFDAVRFLLQ